MSYDKHTLLSEIANNTNTYAHIIIVHTHILVGALHVLRHVIISCVSMRISEGTLPNRICPNSQISNYAVPRPQQLLCL